ncbi:MAG: hypothetical protein J7K98_04150 [Candidatus Aenigmarchaeota archaeon]|nr:hypothetical protein [Candidatus Aenigmarchaeota archaeon]
MTRIEVDEIYILPFHIIGRFYDKLYTPLGVKAIRDEKIVRLRDILFNIFYRLLKKGETHLAYAKKKIGYIDLLIPLGDFGEMCFYVEGSLRTRQTNEVYYATIINNRRIHDNRRDKVYLSYRSDTIVHFSRPNDLHLPHNSHTPSSKVRDVDIATLIQVVTLNGHRLSSQSEEFIKKIFDL